MAHLVSFRKPAAEWIIQVHKHRSIKDTLLGKNKLADDDPLTALIENLIRTDPMSSEVAGGRE